jgi:hypothetical protein
MVVSFEMLAFLQSLYHLTLCGLDNKFICDSVISVTQEVIFFSVTETNLVLPTDR